MPPFERLRASDLNGNAYKALQNELMLNPQAGDVIEGTGGLCVIYYWWLGGEQFWLFTVYDKDQADDLTTEQHNAVKRLLQTERDKRQP